MAVLLIVRGDSTNDIARQLRVSRRTLARWRHGRLFQEEVLGLRERFTQGLIEQAHRGAAEPAVQRVRRYPPSARPLVPHVPPGSSPLLSPAEVAARDPAFADALANPPRLDDDPEFNAVMAELENG